VEAHLRLAVGVEQPPAFELDARIGYPAASGKPFGLPNELLALVEATAEPLDTRELGQNLGAANVVFPFKRIPEALLARIQVAEIPERAEPIPTVHDYAKSITLRMPSWASSSSKPRLTSSSVSLFDTSGATSRSPAR